MGLTGAQSLAALEPEFPQFAAFHMLIGQKIGVCAQSFSPGLYRNVARVRRACEDPGMKRWAVIALALIGGCVGCAGESSKASDGAAPSTAAERIDCGKSKTSAKRALRHLVAVQLRQDDESLILPLLAKPADFFAIGVGTQNGKELVRSDDRREAAKEIADYGGLRLRIDRFMNAERPRRVTDFGFYATWNGRRPATGKAALDCKAGTVIVLGVAVGQQ